MNKVVLCILFSVVFGTIGGVIPAFLAWIEIPNHYDNKEIFVCCTFALFFILSGPMLVLSWIGFGDNDGSRS